MILVMPTRAEQRALNDALSAASAKHLGVLQEVGFQHPQFSITESKVLPAVRATFRSPVRELWLDVAFPNNDPRALKRHVMLAHLHRLHGAEKDGTLYVDWFAAVYRPDLSSVLIELSDGGGSLSDFVRAALPIYATLFRDDLRSILSGHTWESGAGDPEVARAFAFLERDHGFAKPQSSQAGHEQIHTYRRGEVTITITWDGEPHERIVIAIGGASKEWRMPFRDAAAVLKEHPRILAGDFRAIRG